MIRNGTEGGSASPTYEGKPELREVLEHFGAIVHDSGKTLCCFHDETSPSLSVDLNEQLFKCFSCGVAGDAWTAIETKKGLSHKDARHYALEQGFNSGGEAPGPAPSAWGARKRSPKARREGARGGSWSPTW